MSEISVLAFELRSGMAHFRASRYARNARQLPLYHADRTSRPDCFDSRT